ncbi:MAG: calcium-binding protein, partial [Planctomycetota bacterium]
MFETSAALVAQDTNGLVDVYQRDLSTNKTRRAASIAEPDAGSRDAFISADGESVSFASRSSTFVPDTNGLDDIFVWDLASNNFSIVSRGPNGEEGNSASFTARLSRFGRFVVFSSNASN